MCENTYPLVYLFQTYPNPTPNLLQTYSNLLKTYKKLTQKILQTFIGLTTTYQVSHKKLTPFLSFLLKIWCQHLDQLGIPGYRLSNLGLIPTKNNSRNDPQIVSDHFL